MKDKIFDNEIFDDKKFSDLLSDIYSKSSTKEKQIKILIDELRTLVKSIGDATVVVPMIKEYLDVGVKNDELLVKLAQVVQRSLHTSKQTSVDDLLLTDDEIEELQKNSTIMQSGSQAVIKAKGIIQASANIQVSSSSGSLNENN